MKLKVLFVIYSIHGGGAERQMLNLLHSIDRTAFQPMLAVFACHSIEEQLLPPDVPFYYLKTTKRPASLFHIVNLKKLIEQVQPDRIVSFMWSVNAIAVIAARISRHKTSVIISERTFLSLSIYRYAFPWLRKQLLCRVYPQAQKVISVSNAVADDLINRFNVPREKSIVIYNGVAISSVMEQGDCLVDMTLKKPFIIGVGGLNKTKNFPLLIAAFIKVKEYVPELQLLILGAGSEMQSLRKMIASFHAENDIFLPGAVKNPYAYMAKAELFVLSSDYEGLPNVVLEAMVCKVPVIATDCSSGIREILQHEVTGMLTPVNAVGPLADTIRLMLENKGKARAMAEAAFINVQKHHTLEYMVKQYEQTIA
jgi:glycosyltransferase involved in cell wall biosynthesis